MITRKGLADEIDQIDEAIKAYNDSKRDAFDAYRDQMIAAGVAKANVKAEIEAVKAAIKRRRAAVKDKDALIERDELIDEVFEEITRAPRAHVENIEKFDPETGEVFEGEISAKLIETVAAGVQTELGRKALIAAVDIMIAREEAEETQERPSTNDEASPEAGPQAEASPAGTGSGTLADREGRHEGEAASAGLPTSSKIPSDERETDREAADTLAGANAGGEDVDGSAERASSVATSSGPDAKRATNSPETATEFHAKANDDACEAGRKALGRAEASAEAPDGAELVSRGVADRAATATSENGRDSLERQAPNSGIAYEAVPPMPMKSLGYASCFPELSHAAYQRLSDDIADRGVQQPIVRMGDVIVDGWSRYNICRTLGIEYPVVSYHGNDVLLDVIAWQREARQFTPAQERQIAARLAKEIPHRADDIMSAFDIAEEVA